MAEVASQSPTGVLSDDGSSTSRRSSSLASHTSGDSARDRTIRRPKRQGSKQTIPKGHTRDPSLTSFPSFSGEPQDQVPVLLAEPSIPERSVSQKMRERKATLAGLTSVSPLLGARQNALFDDSPRSSLEIPGSLHLAADAHIERVIARVGAVKLVRQYASDLALRDAEISALRARADLRERELKKLLREVNVPSADVEKRLLHVEQPVLTTRQTVQSDPSQKRNSTTSLDGLMTEAMSEDMNLSTVHGVQEISATALLPEPRKDSLAQSTLRRLNSAASGELSRDATTLSRQSSRQPSRTNSIYSQADDHDATLRPRNVSTSTSRLAGLQNLFQAPSTSTSYFIGGNAKSVKKPKTVDELSVRSNQSGKSTSSWLRIFGTGSQANRSRASSLEQPRSHVSDASQATTNTTSTARAVSSAKQQPQSGSTRSRPTAVRTHTGPRLSSSPNHVRKDSNAASLPPTVELDSMIESSQLPPTMTSHNPDNLLTDRFGFIYDQKRKRQHLQANSRSKNKVESTAMSSLRSAGAAADGEANRPPTPVSIEEDSPKKSWQDYLLPSTYTTKDRRKELLSHTPAAGAVITVNATESQGMLTPPRAREISISVLSDLSKALPSMSSITDPQSSVVNVTSSGFSQEVDHENTDYAASKLLLDQLTEVHDALQAERTIKWNDFLRRVRAERANNVERGTKNAPEADLVDGELVGIATLGRSSKTKSKYLHFKTLVLAGIPVSLRPKVWAECSGATQMRIPGYYEELVAQSEQGTGIDREIANQITADVKRTLRDNIFFRDPNGPGAQRLEELLRAYSLHNPKIGYCQGMNLITASLLLICATSEDCFWLLVAMIDHILPSGYFDLSLLTARADQVVLRQYVAEVLPKLDAKLQELGVELEACTFHWFLSLYSGVLTGGEALYRIWDVVLCLNSSEVMPQHHVSQSRNLNIDISSLTMTSPSTPTAPTFPSTGLRSTSAATKTDSSASQHSNDTTVKAADREGSDAEHDGTSSPFLFQLSLALLKLNENAILALDSPATIYSYLNHNMTAHNITIDALVAGAEALRARVKKQDVLERRKAAVTSLT